MKLLISSHHLPLAPALKDYIERRVEALPRRFDRDSCELHLSIETPGGETKRRFVRCSARLTVPGNLLVARKRGRDAYAAVDAAVHALARALDAYHQRVLIGSRFPKKYYVARHVVEEGALPPLVSEGERVFAEEGPPPPPEESAAGAPEESAAGAPERSAALPEERLASS